MTTSNDWLHGAAGVRLCREPFWTRLLGNSITSCARTTPFEIFFIALLRYHLPPPPAATRCQRSR